MTKQIPLPVFAFEYPEDFDERIVITMNGEVVATLDHDQHGWDCMQTVQNVIQAIEAQLAISAK